MIWQPEFTDKTLSRKPGAVHYAALCQHYGMQGVHNTAGRGHENGSVESAHGHLKRRICQALIRLSSRVRQLLPPVDLTELLLEIDARTGFTREFTHVSE